MNSNTLALPARMRPQARPAFYWQLSDMLVLARCQLKRLRRNPIDLVIAALQPVVLLVLFRYFVGGAIAVAGTSYVNYLVAGYLVIVLLLGSSATGTGLADDVQRGLVDRFRSLPMAKSAVLTGRTLADLLRSILIILVVCLVGLLIGFRPTATVPEWIAALGLLLLASLLFSWFAALLGSVLKSAEAVQSASLTAIFLLMFLSNAYVPTSTMPAWLRVFAEHQPVSVIISAVRGLLLNQPDTTASLSAIAWCVGLLVVIIPLAIWAYGRRTAQAA